MLARPVPEKYIRSLLTVEAVFVYSSTIKEDNLHIGMISDIAANVGVHGTCVVAEHGSVC